MGREDRQSEKAEINRRKRWILRESHGRVKKSGFESSNSPVNPSRRDVESFSLSSRSVRESRRYLTQLQPSERNRKRGLVTVPGSCVEFKIPADAEKKEEVITTNRAYLKNETRDIAHGITKVIPRQAPKTGCSFRNQFQYFNRLFDVNLVEFVKR